MFAHLEVFCVYLPTLWLECIIPIPPPPLLHILAHTRTYITITMIRITAFMVLALVFVSFQVLNVAQLARKAASELLATAKAAAATAADNEQHQAQVLSSAEDCVKALLVVLDCVLAVSL